MINEDEPLDWTTFTVEPLEDNLRLDVCLARRYRDVSRTRFRNWIDQQHVLRNDKPATAHDVVHGGDVITFAVPPSLEAAPKPESIPLDVIYEDDDLIIINKAAGMTVHPGAGVSSGTMVNALLGRPGSVSTIGGVTRPGIVHRLDKDTTGLIMVARNDFTHLRLSTALAERQVSRVYEGLALRRFTEDSGVIRESLSRHPKNRVKMTVSNAEHARDATTHWKVLRSYGGISLVECRLSTGRTHQIRVHMAHEAHPLLGDDLYGGSAAVAAQFVDPHDTLLQQAVRSAKRQMLHARRLSFKHPRTEEIMHFEAPLPKDFQRILQALEASVA